jgi:predicted transcriptional regulator
MSALKNLVGADTKDWQKRSHLVQGINAMPTATIEAELPTLLKNKTFVVALLDVLSYSYHQITLASISEPFVTQIYKMIKGDHDKIHSFLQFRNISTAILEEIIDQEAELHATNVSRNWGHFGRIVENPNFTKALEDKLCASPKKYSFMYDSMVENCKDEKNLLVMAKYVYKTSSWVMGKLVKKRCLTHASLEKIAKYAPEAVALHSTRLTPEFVDTLAKSKDENVVAAAMTNKNMRPETMREILLNADPDKDYRLIRNVAWNKKATVENLAIAFSKMPTGFYNLKDFVKRSDLMEFIQKKLQESKL